MQFRVDEDEIRDSIAIYGREHAIEQLVESFRSGPETVVTAIENTPVTQEN